MKKISVILSLLVLVAALTTAWLPGRVLAAGGLTLSNLRIVPTYECLGVRVAFAGTPAVDGGVILQYRTAGTTAWQTAFPMYCDVKGSEFRGSIFWLSPAESYDVQVVGANTVSGVVTTRNDKPVSSGVEKVVSSVSALNSAIAAAVPGTIITVNANLSLSSTVTITKSGTAANPITIRGSNPSITIDGGGTVYNLFDISGNYVRVTDLTFTRNKPSTSHDSALLRLLGDVGCIIENNVFTNGNGFAAVMLRNNANNNLIQNNNFTLTVSPSSGPIYGIYGWKSGGANVVRRNAFSCTVNPGWWDGVSVAPEDTAGYDDDWDCYNNTFTHVAHTGDWDRDDAISFDGSSINTRIWNNRCDNFFTGFSSCPVISGPIYIFRNQVFNSKEACWKIGNNSVGRAYFIHNTVYTNSGDGWFSTNYGSQNYFSRNNIMVVGFKVLETNTITANVKTYNLDYDFLYTPNSQFCEMFSVTDGSGSSSFSGLQGVGLETHGINQADPKFVDAANRDFHLASGSAAIDAGVVLTQFNDANSPWPYQGNAPDIGADEFGSALDDTPGPVVRAEATIIPQTTAAATTPAAQTPAASQTTITTQPPGNDAKTNITKSTVQPVISSVSPGIITAATTPPAASPSASEKKNSTVNIKLVGFIAALFLGVVIFAVSRGRRRA